MVEGERSMWTFPRYDSDAGNSDSRLSHHDDWTNHVATGVSNIITN
jgi:hypothetical protein